MMKSYSYISGGESKPEATQHNILEQSDIQSTLRRGYYLNLDPRNVFTNLGEMT